MINPSKKFWSCTTMCLCKKIKRIKRSIRSKKIKRIKRSIRNFLTIFGNKSMTIGTAKTKKGTVLFK